MSAELGDAIVYLAAENAQLKKDLDGAKKETEGWLSQLGMGINIALGNALVTAVGRGIQAVGDLGRGVFTFAADSQRAVGYLQSELGSTAEEAQILGDVAQAVWKNNFGADVLEAANVVGQVRQQLKQLNTEGIQDAAELAFALRDAYGPDTQKSIDTVRTLTENFGLTYQQAFDFIAAGYQKGLDRSGDFLDSIGEYAPQFATAGAGAGEFFSAMQTGLQGSVLGTDKALDMFKEFRVRLLDGSTATADGLKQIGLSVDEISARINNGSLTWADAFTLIQDRLRNTGDQAAQMQAGVALLGTQFEDMGVQAALGVDLAATKMGDLAGAADVINVRYNNLGDFFSGMGRRLTAALEPAAGALLDIANDAMPELEAAFQSLEANAVPFAVGLAAIFKGLYGLAKAFFRGFRQESGSEMGATANEAGAWGRNIVLQLARGMAAAATAVVQVLNSIGRIIAHWLAPGSPPRLLPEIDKWGQAAMQEFLDGMGEATVDGLRGMGERIMGLLSGVTDGALVELFSTISGTIQRLLQSTAGADDTGLIERIMGNRGLIAQAIADIQQYGRVSEETMAALQASLGGLSPVANEYVQAMLRLYQANEAVRLAQEELNWVTDEYDKKLKPLNDELEALRNQEADMADEKRIAALRQAIARGGLNDEQKAAALREIRARELAMQIRKIEQEKKVAVDGAKEKLKEAEKEKKAAEEQVRLKQALINAQLESNELVRSQVQLLERLAESLGNLGASLGDALGGLGDELGASLGDGLANGLADGLDVGDDPLGLQSIFDEMDIEGLVTEIVDQFKPLEEEVATLGDLFADIRDRWGEVTDKSNPLITAAVGVGIAFASIKLGGLIASLLTTVGTFLTAGGAVSGLGTTLLGLAGPIGIIIAVIAGLALAVATDFMGIRTTSEQLVFIIEWAISRAVRAIGDWLRGLMASLAVTWQNMKDGAKELQTMLGIVWDKIKAKFEELKAWIAERAQAIQGWWRGIGDKVEEMADRIGSAIDRAKGFVQGLWDSLQSLWQWLLDHAFNFNLPDIPDFSSPMGGGAGAGGYGGATPNYATPTPTTGGAGAGGQVISVTFTGDIKLDDKTAVDAFFAYLRGLGDVDALGGARMTYR